MTTSTITTAKQLYETSSVLRGMVDEWVRERRCPLAMVDYLLEHDLYSQAEAARWAATKEKRPRDSFLYPKDLVDYPYPNIGDGNYVWACFVGRDVYSRDVPDKNLYSPMVDWGDHRSSPVEAILWLLDNWRIV